MIESTWVNATVQCTIEQNHEITNWFLDGAGNIPSGFNERWEFNPSLYDPEAEYVVKWNTFRLASNPTRNLEDPFDLRNLRIINPTHVQDALKKLEIFAQNSTKHLVCTVWTWWTISMTKTISWSLRPWFSPTQIMEYAGGGLKEQFEIASFELAKQIDSSQMEIDYIADVVIAISWLYTYLSENVRKKFCGFLVTHGTDTLSQSSTYAHTMLWTNCPFSVWFIAAQKTILDPFSDVGINFAFWLNALKTLKEKETSTIFIGIWGTSGWAYIPARSIKTSDTDVLAFSTPWFEKIIDAANFWESGIHHIFLEKLKNITDEEKVFQPIILRWHTPVQTLEAKMWARPTDMYAIVKWLDALATILVTYWCFTFSRKQIDMIVLAAHENQSLLFATNPFPTGKYEHVYEDSLYMVEKWIVPISCLEHTAYAKILWAQAIWWENTEKIIAFLIWNNFIGEQSLDWNPNWWALEKIWWNWVMETIWQPCDSWKKIEQNT